ncbi:MAG: DUF4301 domain-containing protein [Bacteroidetes bacterium HGW-Bacteroidetes-8]|jgi:hypothetical protein|nr:MAG: DUF4301 domain-containing protein [Bacteroidetes bacterium HGW-Bacteroidetes-8]
MLTELDLKQIEQRGASVDDIQKQLAHFKSGFPYLEIVAPATPLRGIKVLSRKDQKEALKRYESYNGELCKFVPASGAATRMFKDLYEALSTIEKGNSIPEESPAYRFFEDLKKFPFYKDLSNCPSFNIENQESILRSLLMPEGLGYGSMPKGLIKFHRYGKNVRTPFEEHLAEASKYAKTSDGIARMMVTVSKEHLYGFEQLLLQVQHDYERMYGCKFEVTFTQQKTATDTIAVDMENRPFRGADGNLLFRPAGHGALIENLNELESDIVVIKNIDNICRDEHTGDTIHWKRVLIGTLIGLQVKINQYLKSLECSKEEKLFKEIINFLEREFSIVLPQIPKDILKEYLWAKLNRPVRVCGMVKNLGEPGGGPYIVKDADGATSLQILESAQLNIQDLKVKEIVERSTHFNPVDIVCSIKNFRGDKFNLHKYVDSETGFISYKSAEGRPIKAIELPGLWNGAMSQWNTLFVEVPVTTFSPVKTILDLLRAEHQ